MYKWDNVLGEGYVTAQYNLNSPRCLKLSLAKGFKVRYIWQFNRGQTAR